ncbi:MAG: Permease of the drug/metabolite transporter (DMT) superfamily [Burkholderiaceae bacterium]|jgi:drug/metabolite transporter (DMT)-like permease|nr:MAG: Permease of the drug/metabolite transporter (DMT) superfamily [Burkholderiaceae bacterium]
MDTQAASSAKPDTPAAPAVHATPDAVRGLWLGTLGVVIFSLTLPMTRLAVGSVAAPQLSGAFIAMGRAAVAGLLSLLFLAATRAPRPRGGDWPLLVAVSLGAVFGFPLFSSIAMRYVEAVHASVMVGVLPLATALAGAWLQRQRPSAGFWLCAALGSALVGAFALLRSGESGVASRVDLHWADGLLLLAMLCAAISYASGAKLAAHLRADHVICWALVIALPVSLPAMALLWPARAISAPAWWAFGYVAVFSMWIGFFAWYRGLALGGTVRVSQVQLLQPFLSMLFAVPLLGETLDATSIAFALAVLATVFVGRKMPVGARRTHAPAPGDLR